MLNKKNTFVRFSSNFGFLFKSLNNFKIKVQMQKKSIVLFQLDYISGSGSFISHRIQKMVIRLFTLLLLIIANESITKKFHSLNCDDYTHIV